jgi:hypothetical protein
MTWWLRFVIVRLFATAVFRRFRIQHQSNQTAIRFAAPRLAGIPINICYTLLRAELGPECATSVFRPGMFVEKLRRARDQVLPAGKENGIYVFLGVPCGELFRRLSG